MKVILFFFLFFHLSTLFADTRSLVLGGWPFSLDLIDGLKVEAKVLGMELTIFGPMSAKGYRPVISLAKVGANARKLFLKQSKGEIEQVYKSGKNRWIMEHQGMNIHFSPIQNVKTLSGQSGFILGVEFLLKDKNVAEYSYYINCHDGMINIKAILQNEQIDQFKNTINTVARSLKCSK